MDGFRIAISEEQGFQLDRSEEISFEKDIIDDGEALDLEDLLNAESRNDTAAEVDLGDLSLEKGIETTDIAKQRLFYARVSAKKSNIYSSLYTDEVIRTIKKDEIVLVIDDTEKRFKIAYSNTTELNEGYIKPSSIKILNQEEIDAYMKVIASSEVFLYENDINWPLKKGDKLDDKDNRILNNEAEDYKTVCWVCMVYKSRPLKKLYFKKKPYANSEDAGYIYGILGKSFNVIRFVENKYGNLWAETDDNRFVYAGYKKENGSWVESPPVNDSQAIEWQNSFYGEAGLKWDRDNLTGLKLVAGESFRLTGIIHGNTRLFSMPYVKISVYDYIGGKLGKERYSKEYTNHYPEQTVFYLNEEHVNDDNIFNGLSVGNYAFVVKPCVIEYFYHIVYMSDQLIVPFQIVHGTKHTADIENPTITDIKVTNLTSDGYTVTCNVSDNVGVTSVKFPTWTEYNDQDDLIWHEGQLSGNTAIFNLKTSDHNNENGCKYITHIYAYDEAGNSSCEGISVDVPEKDSESPVISNVQVLNVSYEGYTIVCEVSDNVGVVSVKFPTWTEQNDQDDIIWHEGHLSDNNASFNVKIRDHNYENGCRYITHIYAYDATGNASSTGVNVDVPSTPTETTIELSMSSLTMNAGDTYYLEARITSSDPNQQNVEWKSSNSEVASVSSGYVKAISAGETIISATTPDGTEAICKVKVVSEPSKVILNKKKATVVVGGTIQLLTRLEPTDAMTTYEWLSSNNKVAVVSNDGFVTGMAKGTAYIKVSTSNGKEAICKVTVPQAPKKVSFKKSNYKVKVGKVLKIGVKLSPSKAKTVLQWASSDTSVVIVNNNGYVKGISKGTAKIRVKTANGKTKTVKIKVY